MLNIVDYFIHQDFKDNTDQLYRARIYSVIAIAISLIIFSIAFYLVYSDLDPYISIDGCLILIPLGLVYVGSLFVFKHTGRYSLVCNLLGLSTFCAVTVGIYISGGPIKSPASQVAFATPVIMFCLGGMRSGLIWSGIVFVSHYAMVYLHFSGMVFPYQIDTNHVDLNWILDWTVSYIIIFCVIITYEYLNRSLKAERDEEHRRSLFLAEHDPLTNLPNRMAFDKRLTRAINRSQRYGKQIALFYIDLNAFKPINDTLGHDAGDTVLRVIGQRMGQSIRKTDTVARIGGDEFAIILEGINSLDDVSGIAKKLISNVERPIEELDNNVMVTISVGISVYPVQAGDKDDLRKYADLAMYQAKRQNNAWCLFSRDIVAETSSL